MSMKVLINDYPHRTVGIATDDHALIFRHTHSPDPNQHSSSTSLPLPNAKPPSNAPRCMVEFAPTASLDLSRHRNVAAARGTLGLITLNNDVFICVVTGSVEVATIRPGETIQRIYAVEFYCLNRSDYDHGHGHPPNPYPGQTFTSDDFDHTVGYDSGDALAEHPFHALQKLLSGGNFYYSQDFDLTRRLQDRGESAGIVDISSLDEGLLWNSYMINPLLQFRSRLTNHERGALDDSRMLTSVIRGFARTLPVPPSSSPIRHKTSNNAASLTVISRLSSRRAGTRFNSRGIDDNGNVANFVETETVFWSPTGLCFSYTQVRGSVPIFWESTSSLIPGQQKIHITRSPEATQPSFDKHFTGLEQNYGAIHVLNLLSASRPGELELTQRYRYHIDRNPLSRQDASDEEHHDLLKATEFDFNRYTQGATGYEGAQAIRPYIDSSAESFVYFLSEDIEEWVTDRGKPKLVKRAAVIMQQNGVFRVNCLDCLDRTNLVQGMISRMAIELFLSHRDERSNSDFWMRHSTLWADNGDTLSKIYAGTGALKSSFTRHGKMSLAGALADARKSATRLYVNHFEDKNRQNVIDLLLGRLYGQNSVDLFDPVNDWVVAEVNKRRADFETRAAIKVWVGTYNLNGKTTGTREDLRPWLHCHGKDFDIVVVGFQEIVELSPQQIMSTDPNRRMVWESAVRSCLNGHADEKTENGPEDYVLLRSGQLVGAALLIFVKSGMLERIGNVEGAIKKTGMSGIAGNKGAVAIRMEIDSTSVCFVTAHLAAGFGNYDERNRDYSTITSGLHFQRDRTIEDHEVVVWAGDFNYRVGLSYEKAKSLVASAYKGGAQAELALGRLYENDQLNIQMVAGNCFQFYREGRVGFLPTYKFDLGKDEYDSSEKQRIPAWTDRILYKVDYDKLLQGEDLGTRLKQLEYDSVMNMRFSDHRPVYSTFELGVRVVDEAKKDELTRKLYKKRAKEVKARIEDNDEDGDEDDSEIEEIIGYESVQEGLPPASSDRRKWWLDGNKGATSDITPPKPNMVLNPNRQANPWRDGAEEDWVQVERPHARSVSGTSPARSVSLRQKPEPPPSRGTRGRMMAPAWDGDRLASQSSLKSASTIDVASEARGTATPPLPPPSRRGNDPTRTPSVASNASLSSNSLISKKPPPPKPIKPPALTSPSSQAAVPQVSSLPDPAMSRHASVSASLTFPPPRSTDGTSDERPPPLPTRTSTNTSTSTGNVSAERPPPLPQRSNTSSSTASTVVSSVERKLPPLPPPPVQPRRVSKLQGRERDASVGSVASNGSGNGNGSARSIGGQGTGAGEVEKVPSLPPRRTETDMGLMDKDDGGASIEGWEVMRPAR